MRLEVEEGLAMHDRLLPRPAHPGVLTIRPLRGRTGLALIGEADFTARDTLHAAAAALPVDGAGDIHLDLTGLRFIDVCCTRELMAVTDRHPAVRLIVHHPPNSLLRIIALLYPRADVEFTQSFHPLFRAVGDPNRGQGGDGCDGKPDDSIIAVGPDRLNGTTPSDVTDLVRGDHAWIRQLFARLDQLVRDRQRQTGSREPSTYDRMVGETWAMLYSLLKLHVEAEEEIIYPALTATGQPEGPLQAAASDRWDIREALAEARLSQTGSRRWWGAVTAARWAAIRHLRAEEDHLLAAFRRQTSAEVRDVLGRQWIAFILAWLHDETAENHPPAFQAVILQR